MSHTFYRDAALNNAMQQIKSLEIKLDSTNAHHRSAKEAWEVNLSNLEETWRGNISGLIYFQNSVSECLFTVFFFPCLLSLRGNAYCSKIEISYSWNNLLCSKM